jgi:hypothetical protein
MVIITCESIEAKFSNLFYEAIGKICQLANISPIIFESASVNFKQTVDAWSGEEELLWLVAEAIGDTSNTRVVISVSPREEKFKNHCMQEAGHAAWGCCLGGVVAVNYAPQQHALVTQVHESLHLLGVEDCYEEHISGFPSKSLCTNEQCVMRYGSNSTEVCESVLEQIRQNAG